ncbi:hypothetical protein Y1Q_0002254 [Alligator mississippiensis]|uniref:Myb/SANT-like DNA-binding domain-containing protein n=1 Tax=Alligator mississippiensis TaxID=8496 RepID=A0A151MGH1_ALLMI|nr:hypothetical protein Y1Q_0002254 [Alligator mississippiensis]
MRELITIWGKIEIQHKLQKGHCNRDIFKCIAQQIEVQHHNWDYLQCHAKMKVMRSQYHGMLDINKKSRSWRQTMLFYEELFCLCTKDRAINTPQIHGTTGEPEAFPAGTPPEEKEAQGGFGMVGQLGAQELVVRGKSTAA